MRTPPTSPSKAAAPAELPRAKSAPQLRDRDSPDNVQQTPPPVPPIQELPPAAVPGNPARAPASPNSGEARRTLTAVLDALMGTADVLLKPKVETKFLEDMKVQSQRLRSGIDAIVSVRRGQGWSFFRFWAVSDHVGAMIAAREPVVASMASTRDRTASVPRRRRTRLNQG